jgi:hypothetical protein
MDPPQTLRIGFIVRLLYKETGSGVEEVHVRVTMNDLLDERVGDVDCADGIAGRVSHEEVCGGEVWGEGIEVADLGNVRVVGTDVDEGFFFSWDIGWFVSLGGGRAKLWL